MIFVVLLWRWHSGLAGGIGVKRTLKQTAVEKLRNRITLKAAGLQKHHSEMATLYFQSQSADNAGVKEPTDPSIEQARLAGFDLNLIEINLSLTPEERWRQHDMALTVIQEFEQARLTRDARLQNSSTPDR